MPEARDSSTGTGSYTYTDARTSTYTRVETFTSTETQWHDVHVKDGVWPLQDTYRGRTYQLPDAVLSHIKAVRTTAVIPERLGRQINILDIGASYNANSGRDVQHLLRDSQSFAPLPAVMALDASSEVIDHIRQGKREQWGEWQDISPVLGNGWLPRKAVESDTLIVPGHYGVIIAANSLALAASPKHNEEPQEQIDIRIDQYLEDLQFLLSPGRDDHEIGGIAVISVGGAALVIGCKRVDGRNILTVPEDGWWEVRKTDPETGQTYESRALEVFVNRLRHQSQGEIPLVVGDIPESPRIHVESAENEQPFNYLAHVATILA